MAKDAKTTPTAETTPIYVRADWTLSVHGHELTAHDVSQMTPDGVQYLLGNGFSQSLTDAGAVGKDVKAGKSATEVETLLADRRAKRFEAILASNVGHVRVGARLTPIESKMRQVAVGRIRAACAKLGRAMPKDEALKLAVATALERFGADIRAEAEAQIETERAQADQMASILAA